MEGKAHPLHPWRISIKGLIYQELHQNLWDEEETGTWT